MKSRILMYTLLILIFSMLLGIHDFDYQSYHDTKNINPTQSEQGIIQFAGDFSAMNHNEFWQYFTSFLEEHNIHLYGGALNTNDHDETIFVFTSDSNYVNNLPLLNNNIDSLYNFEPYSTLSTKLEYRIPSFLLGYNYEIAPFDLGNPMFTMNGPHTFVNLKREDVHLFNEYIMNEYPKVTPMIQFHEVSESSPFIRAKDQVMLFILFVVCMSIIMNAEVFKKTKKIAILKIEGYSNIKIFLKEYFLILLLTLISILGIASLFFIILSTFYPIFLNLYVFILYYYLIASGIILGSSVVVFLLIRQMNTYLLLKNNHNLRYLVDFSMILKIVFIFSTLSIVGIGIKESSTLLAGITNYQEKYNEYEYWYQIDGMSSKYNESLFQEYSKIEAVYNRLVNEYKGHLWNPFLETQEYKIMEVDSNYLRLQGYTVNEGSIVVAPKNMEQKQLQEIQSSLFFFTPTVQLSYEVLPNTGAFTYADPYLERDAIFIVQEKAEGLEAQFHQFRLYYEGTKEEAINSINFILKEEGLDFEINLQSNRELLKVQRNLVLSRSSSSLLQMLLVLLMIIYLNIQLYVIELKVNGKRAALEYLEGKRRTRIVRNQLLVLISISLITIGSFIVTKNINIVIGYSIFSVLEVLLYFSNNRKLKRGVKEQLYD